MIRIAKQAVLIFLLSLPLAHARDMHGRFGVGYNGQFSNNSSTILGGVPGLSIKYGLTRDIAAAAIVGASTASPTNFVGGAKFFKNIFFETNLNFYFMLGGAVVAANSETGADFLGGLGTEFFIPGLESLGFSVETGVSFSNITGSFILKTMGVSFLEAGIHFYF